MRRSLPVAKFFPNFLRCAQRRQPQTSRIRAVSTHQPGIVGLIRISIVVRNSIAIAIEFPQVHQRFLNRRPGITQKFLVLASCQHIVAVNHQHKFRIQIFPAVGVLPTELVDLKKRILCRHSQIVRYCAFRLALPKRQLTSVQRFPDPHHSFIQIARYGIRKRPHHLLVDLRPEFHQRHRSVKPHIQRFVKRIIETFHKRIRERRFRISAHRASPKRSEVREHIKFVEQHSAIPQRLGFIINIGRLPRVNRFAPLPPILQSIPRDGPRILAIRSVEIRVSPVPLPSRAKLRHRKIPRHHHRNNFLLTRLQREFHRNRACQRLAAAQPRRIRTG